MTSQRWPAYSAIAGFTTVGLACLIALGFNDPVPAPSIATPPAMQSQADIDPVAAPAVRGQPVQEAAEPLPPAPEAGYYDQLRSRLRWVQMRMGSDILLTPDLNSRMLLAKSAAQRARLSEVGLSFEDVYGIIKYNPGPGRAVLAAGSILNGG